MPYVMPARPRQARCKLLAAVIDCDVKEFRQAHDLGPFAFRLICSRCIGAEIVITPSLPDVIVWLVIEA
ncbi:hypothetical protein [Bradyrhizobium sp. BR 1432]|uniref:hypothetical protein n=1 Tax=Bradyrhizobium sp. BR 1432 TaxID=3447966 RepID=UPI003EE468FB